MELRHQRTRTIRKDPHGGIVVTDGQYLELKEVIGGLLILEAT